MIPNIIRLFLIIYLKKYVFSCIDQNNKLFLQTVILQIKRFIYMGNFSADILSICRSYDLEPEDIIFCFALSAGAPVSDAYQIIYKTKKNITSLQAETLANDLLKHKPAAKIIINRIKNKKDPATYNRIQKEDLERKIKEIEDITDEERNELKTRPGLINKIIDSVLQVTGKEAISGLQTLAKLQGLDQPDEKEEEEKRRYFVPWVSNCRSCKLMQLYIKTINENTTKQGETI